MRKRILLRLSLLAAVAVAGFVVIAWSTAPMNITSIEHFKGIGPGMTQEEVEQRLGTPGTDGSILGRSSRKLSNIEMVVFGDTRMAFRHLEEWQTPGGRRIAVGFDDSGKVVMTATFDVEETWLDKIRRWLRLAS